MTFRDFHNIEETKFDIYISKLFSTNKYFKYCAGIQGWIGIVKVGSSCEILMALTLHALAQALIKVSDFL